MPSVMDNIRFRDKFMKMKMSLRNQFITETIAWLESEERAKCKPEHLEHLTNFENELQQQLNKETIAPAWFPPLSVTYAPFPFYDKFLRRCQ